MVSGPGDSDPQKYSIHSFNKPVSSSKKEHENPDDSMAGKGQDRDSVFTSQVIEPNDRTLDEISFNYEPYLDR